MIKTTFMRAKAEWKGKEGGVKTCVREKGKVEKVGESRRK